MSIAEKRTVLTIATGKKLYVDLAVNLARSFFLWHPDTSIGFRIVTDQPESLPADVLDKVEICTVAPGEFGEGFTPKLHLDLLAPKGQTLFIDSDCLVFANLDFLFDRFKGHDVSVLGWYVSKGEWFGDIEAIREKFGLDRIPQFNGGIYYLEKGEAATLVYEKARELEKIYDEIGFIRLRNRPNDEVLMSLAMQLNGQTPISDDGAVMSDPELCRGGYAINVIRGRRWLVNPPLPHPLNLAWYPFQKISPAIIHFLGYYTEHYPYKREVYRLAKKSTGRYGYLTDIIAALKFEYPERLKSGFKNLFRRYYHQLFGFRQIRKSERL